MRVEIFMCLDFIRFVEFLYLIIFNLTIISFLKKIIDFFIKYHYLFLINLINLI